MNNQTIDPASTILLLCGMPKDTNSRYREVKLRMEKNQRTLTGVSSVIVTGQYRRDGIEYLLCRCDGILQGMVEFEKLAIKTVAAHRL